MAHIKNIAFILVLLGFSSTAMAYKYNGYTWKQFPVVWYLDRSGYPLSNDVNNKLQAAMQFAFDSWQTARFDGKCTSIRFGFGGIVNANGARRDGRNVISFAFSPTYNGAPGSMGKTVISPGSGKSIQEADIVFPVAQNVKFSLDPKSWEYDLVGIAMHQIGYMIGLSDSSVKDATMYRVWPRPGDTNWRTLSDDDRQAIVNLYPADCPGTSAEQGEITNAEMSENEKPKLQCSTDFSNAGTGNLLALFVVMLAILWRSRRKQARTR